jgi:hypothetical protein
LATAILGAFGGFVFWSDVAWINPLFYVVAGATGMVCGGLGAIARAHLRGATHTIA